ncbi:MAG: type II toxin-antitoxin system VapC family toxin [Lamprobacter sp.]|uniref:type II toxin-antitoxin system VapC family toxin n=1 Tax=Lamprobacter sp. TaxID=3100796 RepID=UPI002B262F1E|nr:type II toxin-antitoxin system VapC family toxin [Lamprobacter sp.]MEA3643767.1 type II toxin-antitoxin system VapC family toxin [Lamprobacter sp.]
MKKKVYIETSIPSYLTARPSRDVRAAAWQQITGQWWDEARSRYDLFTSELTLTEASAGNPEAAKRRLRAIEDVPELRIDREVQEFAERLIAEGGIPPQAEADALHVAVAAVHNIDYLLTWNCRHIDNAAKKPIIRSICEKAGYSYPEICTPLELLPEE